MGRGSVVSNCLELRAPESRVPELEGQLERKDNLTTQRRNQISQSLCFFFFLSLLSSSSTSLK